MEKTIKILHAADLHLDSPFEGLDEEKAAQRRAEQRETLHRIAEYAKLSNADLVLLAGDLLDGDGVYRESAQALSSLAHGFQPEALLILGSGLGFLGDAVEDPIFVDYGEVPHFRPSTAPGHKGRFVFGTLRGRRVAVMQGRMHCYEGYTMAEAAYAVRVVRLLGAKTLFVTNAAGCVNTDWNVGELMLLSDHIKLFDFGPLRGPNLEEFGTRFPDMSSVYTPRLRVLAHEAAMAHNIPLREGV